MTRRAVVSGLGVVAASSWLPAVGQEPADSAATSQGPLSSQLPLRTTGLEHMGTVVPDVAAAGRFFGRVFNPELHKEKEAPLRYYVTLNPGYLALGTRANESRAFFDHYCALVERYDAAAMQQQLKAEGLAGGRFGIIPDPDGIGLQLLGTPGGLAKSTEPAGRIVEQDALVRPRGLDHVVLSVRDVKASAQFYQKFFGAQMTAGQVHGDELRGGGDAGVVWFKVAGTRLGLQAAAAGEPARVERVGVNVEPFERESTSRELAKLGARIEAAPGASLRFRDPLGLGFDLLPVKR
jgi:catechol 2,3-dioxygenase-like lactoylglutathione lyase family enzyme